MTILSEPKVLRPAPTAEPHARRSRRPRGPLPRAVTVLAFATSLALLAAIAVIGAGAVGVPALTNSATYPVLDASSAPGVQAGSLLVVRPVPANAVRVGDTVTYQLRSGEPGVATRRVLSVQLGADGERSFVTGSDGQAQADARLVTAAQLRGRLWFSLPYLGWLDAAAGSTVAASVISSVAGVLLAVATALLARALIRRRRCAASPTARASKSERNRVFTQGA